MPQPAGLPENELLLERYRAVRATSEHLCQPLEVDDYGIQPMEDASPPKWHLAHTTWFFETFLLKPGLAGYRPFDARFEYLFNSYYNGIGEQFPRPRRGHLSRPTVDGVMAYRAHVDDAMIRLLSSGQTPPAIAQATELGCHHEQQHQELIITDVKCNLGSNPLEPAYRQQPVRSAGPGRTSDHTFVEFEGGVMSIGSREGFCFDNETPRHDVLIGSFALGARLITNEEYLAFMADDGYRRPELWLSEGWSTVQQHRWRSPLYWSLLGGDWWEYRLSGSAPVAPCAPVCHVSLYEADAFARWRGSRLPTEQEWEVAAASPAGCAAASGSFQDDGLFHPEPAAGRGLCQLLGDVWEWTSSAYGPYPGFRPLPGTLGEYNGKFMSSQVVLRGGSCATPRDHLRPTYRNFFYPGDRWQFSGIRLAEDRV